MAASLNQTIATVVANLIAVGFRPITGNNQLDGAQNQSRIIIEALYGVIGSLSYTGIYDPTTSLPPSPALGDIYIASATGNGWTVNNVYSYNGTGWDEIIPKEGTFVWIEDIDKFYFFDGSVWAEFTGGGGSSFSGIPIYADHASAPTPEAGYVTEYFLDGDYDFKYFKWPDGSRHNRRLPLSWETDE